MKFLKLMYIFFQGIVVGTFFSSCALESLVTLPSKKIFFEKLKAGESDYVKKVINNGFPAGAVDGAECTGLHHAAEQKDLSLAKFFIERGVPVDHTNEKGETALFKAVRDKPSVKKEKEAVALVLALLEAGSHIDHLDRRGFTALDHALAGSYAQVVDLLVNRQTLSGEVDKQPGNGVAEYPQEVLLPVAEQTASHADDAVSSESSEDVFPQYANHSVSNRESRKLFYRKLIQGDISFAQNMLLWMTLTSIASENRAQAYSEINRLFVNCNSILHDCLSYFGIHKHIDRICTMDQWHDALMVIFFDELHREMLVSCPMVEAAQTYAEVYAQNRSAAIVEELTRSMNQEKPKALPQVKDQLAQLCRTAAFQRLLKSSISSKIGNGQWNAQSLSVFCRLEALEKSYNVTYPRRASAKDYGNHAEKRRKLTLIPDKVKLISQGLSAPDDK